MANKDPWPTKRVSAGAPSKVNVADFQMVLDVATDERPLQSFLASVPALFRPMLFAAPDFWCFDRPKFGAELIPDFLLCFRNSTGFNWVLIELESPLAPPLTAAGRPAKALSGAQGQVRDWRGWLRDNVAYARTQLGLTDIHAECPAWIVVGRRAHIDPKHSKKWADLSDNTDMVMTYDRIAECATTLAPIL